MDRQIVYPGAIPLETDLLNTNKFAMTGLAKLASVIMGNNTYLYGLLCTPTSPASMAVSVGEGQIYSLQNADGTPYSSLSADNTLSLLKQGINRRPVTFQLVAPTAPGQSINYLIQATYNDLDIGPTVLPYYNAADPARAYSGPDNTGAAQNTVRSGVCVVTLKPGLAARTGSQLTPSPDAGYLSAWVVTVGYGESAVGSQAIRQAADAPFLPVNGLISAVRQGKLTFGDDTGTENHYRVKYLPAIETVIDGMRLRFRAKSTNTGPSYLKVNSLSESRILSAGVEELTAGKIRQGATSEVEWNSTHGVWILCSAISGYSKYESDKRYYSKDGGEISGNVDITGRLKVGNKLNVGSAEMSDAGDIQGEQWKATGTQGCLSDWLQNELSKMREEISKTYIKGVRLGAITETKAQDFRCPVGHVLTGGNTQHSHYYRSAPIQIFIDNQWVTIEGL